MSDRDTLYRELKKVGDKIMDLIIESEVPVLGFVLLAANGDGEGTADVRHRIPREKFKDALIDVASNLKDVNLQ